MRGGWMDAAGLLAGYAVDALVGDPRRFHPVAGYGKAAGALERLVYKPERRDGAVFAAIAVGVPVAVAVAAQRFTARHPLARFTLVAATTWAVLGGSSLRQEGRLMAESLASGDIAAARERLPHLCGRDPRALGEPELARATVE